MASEEYGDPATIAGVRAPDPLGDLLRVETGALADQLPRGEGRGVPPPEARGEVIVGVLRLGKQSSTGAPRGAGGVGVSRPGETVRVSHGQ